MLKSVYIIKDLGVELETDWNSSLRPKWPVHFEAGFCFRSQYIRNEGEAPRPRIAPVKGPFIVEKIEHCIGKKDIQKVYLIPKGWKCAWELH